MPSRMALNSVGRISILVLIFLGLHESYMCRISRVNVKAWQTPQLTARFATTSTDEVDVIEKKKPKWRIVPNPREEDAFAVGEEPPQSPRVYTPRSGGGAGGTQSVSSWSPKSKPDRSGPNGRKNSGNNGAIHVLSNPQLLKKLRMPKEKSEFKIQLETLQEMYNDARDSSSSSYSSGGSSIFDTFSSPSFSSGKKTKGKKDYERKNEDGMGKTRNEHEKRSKVRIDDDDDYEEDSEDAGDYYGDEENLGLSSVPGSYLRNMDREGLGLDEMQIAIYSEYGIKASIPAIKRRIMDDKTFKRTKKRSGKTRKDRTKARKARFAADADTGVELPDQPTIQVQELGALMDVSSGEIVKHLMMNMGIMATMNQNIDVAVAKDIVIAFGQKLAGSDEDDEDEEDDDEEEEGYAIDTDEDFAMTVNGGQVERVARPPIVTIMGHVDHGKTTLLDSIRKTQVALGEAGGITQGISAFRVRTQQDNDITFIDTPGHAAFSEMRTRGASVTDIVILVVAADDGIMEQTKECIIAAKAANCPVVVAVNKVDKEGADPQGVLTDLMNYDILTEEFGGEVQTAQVSAKKGVGIQELLDKILIQSELMNLKAATDMPAEGTVIEARMDKRVGVIATALVREGTLKVGDYVLAGASWGRVRKLLSDQGAKLESAGPTMPVQITGLTRVPDAGDTFMVTETEAEAREVAEARERLARQSTGSQSSEAIFKQAAGLADGTWDNRELIKIPVVIKADVAGSIEALRSSLDALQISDDEATCMADIVYAGVGDVTSSDVAFASVSKAKVLAFNVAAGLNAMDDARAGNVEIGYYSIVYDLLNEIEDTIRTTLAPPPPGKFVGSAEIQKVFRIGKVGKVAGCQVIDGTIKTDSQVRVMRGKRNPVFTGKISSLRVVKDIVTEVPSGSECGVSFEDFQDFMEGDVIECFASKDSSDDAN